MLHLGEFPKSIPWLKPSVRQNLAKQICWFFCHGHLNDSLIDMFMASFSIYQVRMKEAARENIEVARNEEPKLIIKALTEKREAGTHATITLDAAKTNARYDGFYSRTLVRHTRFSGIPALRTENLKSQMKFKL